MRRRTAAEEDDPPAGGCGVDGEVEQLLGGVRALDAHLVAARADRGIAERAHPAVALVAELVLEGVIAEADGADAAAVADVDEDGWLVAAGAFDGVDRADEELGGVAPAFVAPLEEGDAGCSRQ